MTRVRSLGYDVGSLTQNLSGSPRPAPSAFMAGSLVAMLSAAPRFPSDPDLPLQAWHYNMIDLPAAWSFTTGSASVLVAVVDDGIRFDHPDLASRLTTDGFDFVANDPTPICGGGFAGSAGDGNGPDTDPTNPGEYVMHPTLNCITGTKAAGGHGLHVAGTIGAAASDGVGGSGVNWAVRIRPIRVIGSNGSGSVYEIAQGILYAAGLPADGGGPIPVQAPSRAPIINLSLGGYGNHPTRTAAVEAAIAAGSLLVAAAGNDNTGDPMYPAALPGVIAVAAVGSSYTKASYSNFASPGLGSRVDIAAPGGETAGNATGGVYSAWWNFATNQPTWTFLQGTSMAAPHVSGVAALLLAREPGLTAAQLKSRLLDYAVDIGAAGLDSQFGHGLLNARNSLTQSFAPPRALFAKLFDATTGATLQSAATTADGSYSFAGLGNGSYLVFAGEDEDGDGVIGAPGRRWSGFGGTATPALVTITGAGQYVASFAAGYPLEAEPNDGLAQASHLALGGYLAGFRGTGNLDVFRVVLPVAGTYTFETSALLGACGFAGEEDTILGLHDSSGALIVQHDDIDFPSNRLCSRITRAMTAGTYYISVSGYSGGYYRIQARGAP
jgi:subtilisin family serine protease